MRQSTIAQNKTLGKPALILAALAVLIFIWTLWFYYELSSSNVSQSNWAEAAEKISKDFAPADRVAIVPFWASMGEQAFVERHLPYRYVRYVSKEDWTGTGRLWVVSAHNRFVDRDEWISSGQQANLSFTVGSLKIERFPLSNPPKKTYSFTKHLSESDVSISTRGKAATACEPWDERTERFSCSKRIRWFHVGQKTWEIGDAVREVIWAHPRNNHETHILFRGVPIRKRIVIYTGLDLYSAASKNGAEVQLKVLTDGRKIGVASQKNVRGWHRHEFAMDEATNGLHDVELIISSPNDGRRHFVFNGYAE